MKDRLTVSIWRDLCGGEVIVLQNSSFYPSYPNEKLIPDISEFSIVDDQAEYGQTIAGFLNPARSGSYRFAIASDDSSELWLSPSENPEEKQLIASVFVDGAAGWTTKNEINKYTSQISRDIALRNGGRYYIEVVHKQGEGDGFVQGFWSNPGVTDFKLISSEYLSSCSLSPKQDAMNQLLAKRLAISQTAWEEDSNFFALPLISEADYRPQCAYKSSFVPKDKIAKYNWLYLVDPYSVFPQDDTFMGSKGNVWSWSNRVADREIVQSGVDKMMAALYEKTAK
ncbi:N-acetyl-beta-glucosaminyl-glycoprotein 4-beta-N-acetylgalactosaminyltransferase 1-like [Orbicella faveolata]|uniref:N-acetyl-beta-glucosaminyl-glycoprotein 4-beta-N-acetylgalactosaminyltransferase 1-like n=1 Tax=Orbicella faveolata TaxID=48498 RepID=UPI0009E3D981|nr:N-acetyl-beta-glucosaminyl-glycoprotein 4-beta-N-acetylgalactosaminyltransferase 1-like [Orbicella faveolata]